MHCYYAFHSCSCQVMEHLAALRNRHTNKGIREMADEALVQVVQQVRMWYQKGVRLLIELKVVCQY